MFLLDIFFKIGSLIMGIFPRKLQTALANTIGFLWFDVFRFRRTVILENLKLAFPEKDLEWHKKVGRKSTQNLCLSFLDYFILYRVNSKNISKYVQLNNVESLKKQIQEGQGTLVLSLHLGTIDLAPAALALNGYKVHITLKTIKNKTVDLFINNLRRSKGVTPLADRRNPFEIFRSIKKGYPTIFIMDQYMGNPHGRELKFFGHPAGTAVGLAGFSLKTGLPVIPMYNFRRADGMISIVSEDPILPESISDVFEENIRYNTQKYNDRMELIIKKYPEQWMWVHRRWKKFS